MSFETEKQEGLAHISCNNADCPMNEDEECHCNYPIEIFHHPSYPASFACWWDDNKDEVLEL